VRIIRDTSFALRWVSLIFLAAAIVLTMIEVRRATKVKMLPTLTLVVA